MDNVLKTLVDIAESDHQEGCQPYGMAKVLHLRELRDNHDFGYMDLALKMNKTEFEFLVSQVNQTGITYLDATKFSSLIVYGIRVELDGM